MSNDETGINAFARHPVVVGAVLLISGALGKAFLDINTLKESDRQQDRAIADNENRIESKVSFPVLNEMFGRRDDRIDSLEGRVLDMRDQYRKQSTVLYFDTPPEYNGHLVMRMVLSKYI